MRWGRWGPLVLFAVALPAFATQVRVVPDEKSSKGAVMVSHGKGYAPISGPTVANTGNSVIAFTGGLAKIVYPDGCTIDVNAAGTVFFVSETSPCKGPAGFCQAEAFQVGSILNWLAPRS